MKQPIASIIMPTYNRVNYLERAIKSVLEQTFQDWELIIIDDASTDNTPNILENWRQKDNRIKVLRNEKNNYPDISKNLNNGINLAKGKYIARLDDDDYWCDKNKLKKQIDFLENNSDYVIVGGGMIVIDKNGNEMFRYLKKENDNEIRESAILTCPFSHTTVIFLKNAALKAGLYENNKYAEDWGLWLKLGKLGKFYNIPEYLTHYTMDGKNKSLKYLRQNAINQINIAFHYKKNYPHFYKAFFLSLAQYFYSFFPLVIKKTLNPLFSRIKRSL